MFKPQVYRLYDILGTFNTFSHLREELVVDEWIQTVISLLEKNYIHVVLLRWALTKGCSFIGKK